MTSGRINQFATHCEESQEHTIARLVAEAVGHAKIAL